MTDLWVGGEDTSFVGGAFAVSTFSPAYQTSYSRCVIQAVKTTGQHALSKPITATSGNDFWFHASIYGSTTSGSTSNELLGFRKSSTQHLQIVYDDNEQFILQTNISSAMTTQTRAFHEAFSIPHNTRFDIDIHVVVHASAGSVNLYINGASSPHATWTNVNTQGDNGSTNFDDFILYGFGLQLTYWSQIKIADVDTRGHKVHTLIPTGAGSNSAWTGTFADIDEVTYNSGDAIQSGTADQVSTFAMANPAAALTGQITSLTTEGKAATSGGSPTQLQLAVRSGATNFFSATKALSGEQVVDEIWSTDPNTAAVWTKAAVDAVEVGAKSIA